MFGHSVKRVNVSPNSTDPSLEVPAEDLWRLSTVADLLCHTYIPPLNTSGWGQAVQVNLLVDSTPLLSDTWSKEP